MFTTTIAKAALPNLGWTGSEPGLLAILVKALRKPEGAPGRRPTAKPQPVPFAWL